MMPKLNLSPEHISLALKNFFSKVGATVGIDIGSAYLKMVELKKSRTGYALDNFICIPIPSAVKADDKQYEQFLIDTLKTARREGKISGLYAFLAVSGQEVNTLSLILPRMPKKDLRNAIALEIRKQVAFDPQDSSFDFQVSAEVVDRAGPKLQLFVAIVKKKVIEAKINILYQSGFKPLGITIVSNALENILEGSGALFQTQTVCLLEIGGRFTILSIFKSGRLEFSRDIIVAGDHLTQTLVRKITLGDKEINIGLDQAEELKRDYGIPLKGELEENIASLNLNQSHLLAMLRPTLERFTTEISRSMNYYLQSFKVSKIDRLFLSGGGARLKNIENYLSGGLKDIKTQRLNPLDVMAGWADPGVANQQLLEELAPHLSVAMGLAMGIRKTHLDLLPHEIKIQDQLGRVKMVLKIVIPIMTATIMFFYFLASMQVVHYRRIISQAKETVKSFAPTKALIIEYDNLKQKMEQRQSLLEKAVGRQPLWWGILKELGTIHIEGVTLAKISVVKEEGQSLQLGMVGQIAPIYTSIDLALSQYLLLLDESPFFEDVKLISTSRDVYSLTPKADFEIMLRLVY